MTQDRADTEGSEGELIARENGIHEKMDGEGKKWRKVYFGGGAHFRNWMSQIVELLGEDNVEVEEADSAGFQCYRDSGEKLFRVWVREGALERKKESP